jgi:hypothetical protein
MALDGRRTKMKNADIKKVDFVPAGAQQDSRISIFKSDETILGKIVEAITKIFSSNVEKVDHIDLLDSTLKLHNQISTILKSDSDNKNELIQGTIDQYAAGLSDIAKIIIDSEDCMKKLQSTVEKLGIKIESNQQDKTVDNNVNKQEGSEGKVSEINKSALPQDVQDYIKDLEEKVAKAAQTPTNGTEDIYKGLPENVAKVLKETITKNQDMEKQIAKMADEKIEKTYIDKAAEFKHLNVKPEEFGLVLKKFAIADADAYTKLETVLKSANEAIEKGGLFQEIGTANGASVVTSKEEAWNEIKKLATAKVTKGESKTEAEAIEEVLKTAEGRKLYARYTGKM